MGTLIASLAFAVAALLAAASIAATWRRYRTVALGHLGALRGVEPTREFRIRVVAFGGFAALPAHPAVRRLPHRSVARRPASLAPVRRAAA